MLPITHGIWASNSSGFNSFYQDILDYGTSQGYTLPSDDQQELQNALVESMVNLGVWDNLDVFYVFATDAGSDFARINWIDPNRNYAQPVNAPSFTSNEGYAGNAASLSYIDTDFVVGSTGANFQNSDACLLAYIYDDIAHNTFSDIGLADVEYLTGNEYGAINSKLPAIGVLNTRAEYSLLDPTTSPFNTSDVPTSVGLSHVDRSNSTQINFYKNGTLLNTQTAIQTNIDRTLRVNFLRGRFAADYSERTISIGGAGGSIAFAASGFGTAITTYMTSI